MLNYIIICTAISTGAATILTEIFKRYITKKYTGYVPLFICLATAFIFKIGLINAISSVEYANSISMYMDYLLSGILMTKGSNYIFELAKLKSMNEGI